jgi:hypothetical protein
MWFEWKCSENINSPSGDQYRIFSRIVEPCKLPWVLCKWD